MKYFILLFVFVSFHYTQAQNQSCDVQAIQSQIDSVKILAKNEGFSISKEAIVPMENQYETPVIVELSNQKIYKLYFIGQPTVKLLELRVYDYAEKEIAYIKKQVNFSDPNIIQFDIVPKFTELYMMRFVQVHQNKKIKQICGYIVLLEFSKE